MIPEFVSLAVRNIRHRKRRSWLTIIGIFIGIAAVVALVSLGQGLQDTINREFEQIGADKIYVQPGTQGATQGGGISTQARLTDADLDAVRRVQGVEMATGALFRSTRVTFRDTSSSAVVIGVPGGEEKSLVEDSWNLEPRQGRFVRDTDTSNIVIGDTVQQQLFTDIGLRSKLEIEGSEFRVVGILEPSGDPAIDRAVFLPMDRVKQLLEVQDEYDWILVQALSGLETEAVQADIEQEMRNERGVDEGEEDFTVYTTQELVDSVGDILGIVNAVVVGIAAISLLVGGVGIMNTMYTSVTERTREIGVMKAIGAKNKDIMLIFLLESGMMGLLGGAVGAAIGIGLGKLGAYFARQASAIDIFVTASPSLIFGSLLFAFLVGTISGILPARRAAGMNPADALRYE